MTKAEQAMLDAARAYKAPMDLQALLRAVDALLKSERPKPKPPRRKR